MVSKIFYFIPFEKITMLLLLLVFNVGTGYIHHLTDRIVHTTVFVIIIFGYTKWDLGFDDRMSTHGA